VSKPWSRGEADSSASLRNDKQIMGSSEAEMLREAEEAKLGARRPFESARQATYEDSLADADVAEWEREES
jgi:hypothetical protein